MQKQFSKVIFKLYVDGIFETNEFFTFLFHTLGNLIIYIQLLVIRKTKQDNPNL